MKRILIFFTFLFIIFSIYNYDIFFKSNPVKEIVTEGNSVYLDQKLLNKNLSDLIGTEIYSINLRELKTRLERDPWIKSAQIIIDSPNILVVKIIERKPMFLWNRQQYVDDEGILFKPDDLNLKNILLIESTSDNHQFMYKLYKDLKILFSKIDLIINKINKDDDMLIISTSKYKFSVRYSMYQIKIEEFIAVYNQFINSKMTKKGVQNIDLRYPTGFAVQ